MHRRTPSYVSATSMRGTMVQTEDEHSQEGSAYGLTKKECMQLCDEQNDQDLMSTRFASVDQVAKLLLVNNLKKGLTGNIQEQMIQRKQVFGENRVPEPPTKTYIHLLIEALKDTTMLILCAAAVVSLILAFVNIKSESPCSDFDPNNTNEHEEDSSGEFTEAVAILIAVVVVSNVTAINDYSKERQFQKLNEASRNTVLVQVTRDGRRVDVMTQDIVVGDVLHVDEGDKVPADGICIDGQNLVCDESALTGEPIGKQKTPGIYMKSGAHVSQGGGRMVVLAVGENTDEGEALAVLGEHGDATPLQHKLDVMAALIGKGGLAMAVLTVVSATIRFAICRADSTENWNWKEIRVLLDYFILAITIIVVAVPEGLPLAVTISLAYSMRKMMKDQNLVRRLQACETMGGATNVCSDKTGTLTENRMAVTEGLVLGHLVSPIPQQKDTTIEKLQRNLELFNVFLQGLALNTQDSSFVQQNSGNLWDFKGNKTECALLVMCHELGGNFDELREEFGAKRLKTIPFSSNTKRMTNVIEIQPNKARVHVKGAGEIVINHCSHTTDENGNVIPMTDQLRVMAQEQVHKMASSGLRTLCIAFKDLNTSSSESVQNLPVEELEADLTMLALVGIKDPVRASVPAAVAACKTAGIVVRMVTGDNIETAKHIAKECGIFLDGGIALEGSEFREMSRDKQVSILPRLQVLARSKPTDKYLLVRLLRSEGEVVAVTGDGTNDAPALKEADVGLSMGLTGTDVAQMASDIVILDDNFASIVRSVMWGRNVYDSIRKFLQFQLTVNVSALCVAYVGAVVNSRSPLTPVQLLWVNLIMDTLAALALATDPPTRSLLDRKPYGRTESLVDHRMWINILGQSLLQVIILLTMLFAGEDMYISSDYDSQKSRDKNYTMIFNAFVFLQLFNEINSRKLGTDLNVFSDFFGNKLFVGVMVVTTVLQVILVELGGNAIEVDALNVEEFFVSFAIGFLSIPMGVLLKFVPDPFPKKNNNEQQQETKNDNNKTVQDPKASFTTSGELELNQR